MSRTVNFGQSVSEKGIDPGKTLSPPSLFGYFAAARPDLDHSTTRMWISAWACLDPRGKGCSELEESSKADEHTQRQKELADCKQEVARLSLKGSQGAASSRGPTIYKRLQERCRKGRKGSQTGADSMRGQDLKIQKRKSERSPPANSAAEAALRPVKKTPSSPSKGALIKAVPGQRSTAQQEGFKVETSWLSVADVSFADMLQMVDVAARKSAPQSQPRDGRLPECTVVFPKLKGRVSDSGCRPSSDKKVSAKPLPNARLLSSLAPSSSVAAQPLSNADASTAARRSADARPCKAGAARATADSGRPGRAALLVL